MTALPKLCRVMPSGWLDHDWRTIMVVLEDGAIEETQECIGCGLRRVDRRRDEELAVFTDMRRAA